jgi:starch phosphorylase
MVDLTLQYSATRMMRDYLNKAYLPAAQALRERLANNAASARLMAAWDQHMHRKWANLHIGEPTYTVQNDGWDVLVPIYLGGEITIEDVQVQAYAPPIGGNVAEVIALAHDGVIPGASHGYLYIGRIPGFRSADDYTVRVVPSHPGVRVPTETTLIHWQR